MMNLSGMMDKKIGPVPVIYIALGFVAILGVVAWRMKPASEGTTGDTASGDTADATLDENGQADGSDPYAGYRTNGTVIVQPATPTPADDPASDKPVTNDEWKQQGALWLNTSKQVNPSAAYNALSKYIKGESKSAQEASWADAVVVHQGFPPEPFVGSPNVPGPVPVPTVPKPDPTPTTPKPIPAVVKAPPTNVHVIKKSSSSLMVAWSAPAGPGNKLIGYRVFINGSMRLKTLPGSPVTIPGLKPRTRYAVAVCAVYPGWIEGPRATIYATTN